MAALGEPRAAGARAAGTGNAAADVASNDPNTASSDEITIRFDTKRCIHSRRRFQCVRLSLRGFFEQTCCDGTHTRIGFRSDA